MSNRTRLPQDRIVNPEGMAATLLGGHEGSNPGVCPIRAAVGAYATYRVTNMARSLGGISAEATRRAFRLAVTDATAGHGKTMATMRGKLRGLDDVEEEAPTPAPRRRRQR